MFRPVLSATVLTFLLTAPASAQTTAACQPLFAAMDKLTNTPNHATITRDGADFGESISVNGAMYVKVRGMWVKSPTSMADTQKRMKESLDQAKYACARLPDESVAGAPAVVIATRSESAGGVSESKVWIAKATGLPIKSEEDLTAPAGKLHMSVKYDYANIQAPIK
jgi:hypothetical protein